MFFLTPISTSFSSSRIVDATPGSSSTVASGATAAALPFRPFFVTTGVPATACAAASASVLALASAAAAASASASSAALAATVRSIRDCPGAPGAPVTPGVLGSVCLPNIPPNVPPPIAPKPAAVPTPCVSERVGSISCSPTLEANFPPPSSKSSLSVSPAAVLTRPAPGSPAMRFSSALAPGSWPAATEIAAASSAATRPLLSAIFSRSSGGISGYCSLRSFNASLYVSDPTPAPCIPAPVPTAAAVAFLASAASANFLASTVAAVCIPLTPSFVVTVAAACGPSSMGNCSNTKVDSNAGSVTVCLIAVANSESTPSFSASDIALLANACRALSPSDCKDLK